MRNIERLIDSGGLQNICWGRMFLVNSTKDHRAVDGDGSARGF